MDYDTLRYFLWFFMEPGMTQAEFEFTQHCYISCGITSLQQEEEDIW